MIGLSHLAQRIATQPTLQDTQPKLGGHIRRQAGLAMRRNDPTSGPQKERCQPKATEPNDVNVDGTTRHEAGASRGEQDHGRLPGTMREQPQQKQRITRTKNHPGGRCVLMFERTHAVSENRPYS
jgi:hypothetical protein